MMKKLYFTLISVFILLSSCSDFNEKAKPLYSEMQELYLISKLKCDITSEVWKSAIYDKIYYFSKSNKYEDLRVYNFSDAISRMQNESEIVGMNKIILSTKSNIETNISKIKDKNHPDYDKLMSLYTYLMEYCKLAVSPDGSLNSFREQSLKMENQINLLITELKARNDEFEIVEKQPTLEDYKIKETKVSEYYKF